MAGNTSEAEKQRGKKTLINFLLEIPVRNPFLEKWKSAEPRQKHRAGFVCLHKGRGQTREDHGLGTEPAELKQHTQTRANMKDNSPRDLKHFAAAKPSSLLLGLPPLRLSTGGNHGCANPRLLGCSRPLQGSAKPQRHRGAESPPLNPKNHPFLQSSPAMPPLLCSSWGKLE